MEMQTFLGMPPSHIVKWIQDRHKQTRIEFVDGTEGGYLIEGAVDCPALIAAGLMPEGSGTESEPSWNNQPVKVKIGSAVTGVGDWAFYECRELTSVTIPNSVTSIGQDAFCYCGGLTSVAIPNSVTSIGYQAFDGCEGLTNVTIPDSVTNIGNLAFAYCGDLTSVTIASNGGNAENVKQMMIEAGVPETIAWNMPETN